MSKKTPKPGKPAGKLALAPPPPDNESADVDVDVEPGTMGSPDVPPADTTVDPAEGISHLDDPDEIDEPAPPSDESGVFGDSLSVTGPEVPQPQPLAHRWHTLDDLFEEMGRHAAKSHGLSRDTELMKEAVGWFHERFGKRQP